MTHGRWSRPVVAVALVGSLGACNWDDPAPPGVEQQKFDALRADPLFSLAVPGGTAEPITATPGHGGQMPSPTQAFRSWTVGDTGDGTFIETVRQAAGVGLQVEKVFCGPNRLASGAKLIDGYVAQVTIGLGPVAHDKLQVTVQLPGGSDAVRRPLPPRNRIVDEKCPDPIKALVPGP